MSQNFNRDLFVFHVFIVLLFLLLIHPEIYCVIIHWHEYVWECCKKLAKQQFVLGLMLEILLIVEMLVVINYRCIVLDLVINFKLLKCIEVLFLDTIKLD